MARSKKSRRAGHNRNAGLYGKTSFAAPRSDISLLGGGPKKINTTQYDPSGHMFADLRCNARVEERDADGSPKGKSGFVKTRQRKTKMGPAGSQYYVPIDTRPFCGEPAVKSKLDENGARQHRCTKHSFSDE